MTLEQDVEYLVTKSSNEWFNVGEIIVLKEDGCIYVGKAVIEPGEIETAMQGMECRPFVPTMTNVTSDAYDLLLAVHNLIDGSCYECDSNTAKEMLARLLAKIKRGEKC